MNTSLRRRRTAHRAVAVLAIAGVALAAAATTTTRPPYRPTPATAERRPTHGGTGHHGSEHRHHRAPDTTGATTDTTAAPAATDATTDTSAPAASGDAEPLRIGFLPPGLEIPAFQGLWHGLEGYGGGRYGDEVVAVDAKFDPTAQVQTIEQWVQLEQVDGIWIIPVVAEAIAPACRPRPTPGSWSSRVASPPTTGSMPRRRDDVRQHRQRASSASGSAS